MARARDIGRKWSVSDRSAGEVTKSMTTIGHVFIPLDRAHDGAVPTRRVMSVGQSCGEFAAQQLR